MGNALIGRYAKVTIGDDTIANIASYTLNESADELDASVFGSGGWGGTMPGQQKWKSSINGFLDPDDTTGQVAIKTAKRAGNKITDIRFYLDNTDYSCPDLTNDSDAGAYITAFEISPAVNNLIPVRFDVVGVGPVCDTY
jgi:hypothetical protein